MVNNVFAHFRGSFCNAGMAFRFEYFGGVNITLAFGSGRKRILLVKTDFIEYTGAGKMLEDKIIPDSK